MSSCANQFFDWQLLAAADRWLCRSHPRAHTKTIHMKTNRTIIILALSSLLTFNLQFVTAFAQGNLTPPGAPTPTMKTLDQIEARSPISSAPLTITNTGSYYLTTNLTVGSGTAITIATNGVTLDLNGFTITSTAASATGYGILLNSGLKDIAIMNGHVRGGVTNNGSAVYSGSGFSFGISGATPVNVLVKNVSVSGCLTYGICLGSDSGYPVVVESCTVRTVGSYGIQASTIKSSVATDCGYNAVYGDQVSDCRGESTGNNSGYGIYAYTAQNCYGYCAGSGSGVNATTAQNCYGRCAGSGNGITASTAQNCYGYCLGSGYGIQAIYVASGCFGFSNTGTGLYAYNAAFCTGTRINGTAIQATIASGCIAINGTNIITYKYNMP